MTDPVQLKLSWPRPVQPLPILGPATVYIQGGKCWTVRPIAIPAGK